MHLATTWQQVGTFDPSNPNQRAIERYVGVPGGYGSFYFDKVPTTSSLMGPGGFGATGIASLPDWAQVALAAGVAVGGYAAYRHFSAKKAAGLRGARRQRTKRRGR